MVRSLKELKFSIDKKNIFVGMGFTAFGIIIALLGQAVLGGLICMVAGAILQVRIEPAPVDSCAAIRVKSPAKKKEAKPLNDATIK